MPLSDEEKAARAARYAIIEARYTREELIEKGKWWNVPEKEHAELMRVETTTHPWEEMIAPRLAERGLFLGRDGEAATPWDGTLVEHANWGNIVTTTRIGIQWLRLTPDSLGRGMANTKTIGACMRKLGWEMQRRRVDGMEIRPNVWTPTPEILSLMLTDSLGTALGTEIIRDRIGHNAAAIEISIRTDDEDIPF